MNFNQSQTKINLMRAFAGESQARNRYTISAEVAKTQKLHVIEQLFLYTADQEKAHANVFFQLLKDCNNTTIDIDAGYPVSVSDNLISLLRQSTHNEFEENSQVYPEFARIAREEGFLTEASKFEMIAEIEKKHGQRFQLFADLLEQGRLFASEKEEKWICLNCGYIYDAKEAYKACPVCSHNQGYMIRLGMSPYEL